MRHSPSYSLKAFITLHMAIRVIVIFEKVYVQHDERKRCPGADVAIALIGEHGVKMPPVGNFCQAVLVGHQLEFVIGFREGDLCKLSLRNVFVRHHNHAWAISAERVDPAQKPALLFWRMAAIFHGERLKLAVKNIPYALSE